MIKKPTKEEMYVVNQPRHLMISIILMDYDYYPLPDNIHTGLCKLSEISDIVFIFSDSHFDNSKISKEKITTLYQACAFIDSSGNPINNINLYSFYSPQNLDMSSLISI